MKTKIILFSILFFKFFLAHSAYFQADLISAQSNLSLGTHLIIAGKGLEVGDQWLSIAHTQALVFKDKAKHGRIRIISAIDNANTYASKLNKWGYQNVITFNQAMTDKKVVDLIIKSEKIASLDFIGHNGVVYGFALEDYSNRFYKNGVDLLKSLKPQFMPDSYIRILGCNTGWVLAPYMANALQVPTSGTFTFADIQDLFTPMTWYYHDEGRYPKIAKHVSQNLISFSKPTTCINGAGCQRLKTVSIPYSGKHGSYTGTLPFAKYFCSSMNMNDCARRASLSILTNVSTVAIADKPSAEGYQKAVSDHMCSSWQDLSKRVACAKTVSDHLSGSKLALKTYTTITDKMLTCSFKICNFKQVSVDGQTLMQGVFDTPSTAFYDELNFYKLGFSLL
jgi:hypothetical protein